MTVIQKNIGRLPVNLGDYDSTRAYGKKNRVLLYGCEWESKVNNNTYAPAALNTTTGVITPDTTHWKLISGSYKTWLIDNGYQKMDASNVEDGNHTQHEINEAIVGEIGDNESTNTIKGRITTLEGEVGTGGSVDERIAAEGARHYLKSETYTKSEVNGMITTPDQEYVTVTATDQTTAVTDVLPATGEPDTVYRVGNWDGNQYDATAYSEYAWNESTSQYIHLSTKTQVGEVFDISAYHATGSELAKYADLAAALDSNNGGGVPQSLQKGGMSIKFVQSSDNKYVQYRLMSDTFSTTESDWQGVDEEPIVGSRNLIESGAVSIIKQDVNGNQTTDYTSELQLGSIATTGIGNVNPLTIAPDNTWKYAIIPVIAGQQYELKLRGGSTYPACILLDKNNITIAEYVLNLYTTRVVTIPDGVTTMAINDDPRKGTPSIIRLASGGLHGFIERVEKKADSVLSWNNMVVYSGWINFDGTFKSDDGLIKLIPVTPNSTITFKRSGTANSYLFVLRTFNPDTYFYGNADCVESYPQRVFVDYNTSLLIPADARYIAITYYDITDNKYCYPNAIFVDGIDITLIYKSCRAWDDLFEYSGYISWNNIFEQDTARFKLIPVKGGDTLYFQQNATANSYYFMLKGFDELRYIQYPPYFSQNSNERLRVVTGMIVVPNDVKYIAITSKNSNGIDNSPYIIAINGVDIKQNEKFPIDIVSLNADKDSVISSSSAFMGKQMVSGQKTRHKYLTLLHGSDYHADEYNFIRTMDFAAHYNKDIDAVIASGDLVLNTFAEDTYEKLFRHYQEAGCPVLPVIGNHELGYGEDNAKFIYEYDGMTNSVADCAARFITPYMSYNGCAQGGNGGGYYYKDFSDYKVRVITICEYEMPRILEQGTENVAKYAFWFRYLSQTQVNWLITTLNSVQEGWSVIVVMHQPIDTITKYDNPFSSPYKDGGWSAQGKIVQDIIDAYIDKTSINNTYTNTKGYDTAEVPDVTVDADFSNAKGTFICYLCGHTHWDMVGQSSQATNKQVCLVMNTSSTTKAYYDDLYRCMYKQSQDCLNMLVFDTDKKQIRILRIGANTTLDMKERKMTCISYSQE